MGFLGLKIKRESSKLLTKKDLFYVIVITSLVIFSLKQCSDKNDIKEDQTNQVEYLNSELKTYRNKYDEEVATRKSLAGDYKQVEILLSKYVDSTQQFKELAKKYKKIKSAVKIKTVTEIDSVKVPFDKEVACKFERPFKKETEFYSIEGLTTHKGNEFHKISTWTELSYIIGERKNGLFKRNTISIDAKASNPNVSINQLDSYIYTPNVKKFHFGPGIFYDPFNNNVSGGIILMYSIGSF